MSRIFKAKVLNAVLVSLLATGCANDTSNSGTSRSGFQTSETAQLAGQQLREEMIDHGDRALYANDAEAALLQYVEALKISEDAELFMRIATAYEILDNVPKSVAALQRVVALEPESAAAWERLGLISLNNRNATEAVGYLQKALAIEPNRWRSQNGLGVAADLRGDFAAASTHYNHALAFKDDSAMLLTNYGYSFYLLGDYDRAKNNFYKALELDNDYKRAWANLALLNAREGDYREAIDLLSKVRKDYVANNDIGYIAMLNQDFDEAQLLLERSARLSPSYYVAANKNLEQLRDMATTETDPAKDLSNTINAGPASEETPEETNVARLNWGYVPPEAQVEAEEKSSL